MELAQGGGGGRVLRSVQSSSSPSAGGRVMRRTPLFPAGPLGLAKACLCACCLGCTSSYRKSLVSSSPLSISNWKTERKYKQMNQTVKLTSNHTLKRNICTFWPLQDVFDVHQLQIPFQKSVRSIPLTLPHEFTCQNSFSVSFRKL